MVQLEQERLALLAQAERNHGLIIPVVFRGFTRIPTEIKNFRQCYDFSGFTLTDNQMSAHPKFAQELKNMAEYIADRYRSLNGVVNPKCDDFSLPRFEDIEGWLSTVIPENQALPGRTNA